MTLTQKMESWTVSEVCYWLLQNNMGDLVEVFREEAVNGRALMAFSDRMVQQIVSKIGHPSIIMQLILKLRQQIGVETAASSFEGSSTQMEETAGSSFQPPAAQTRKPFRKSCIPIAPVIKDRRKIYFVAKRQQSNRRKRQSTPFSRVDAHAMAQRNKYENVLVQQRMATFKKNRKCILTRSSTQKWSMYTVPQFPVAIQTALAGGTCPEHTIRTKIIEILQINMTKFLEHSLYPTTQQFDQVIRSLIQLYPFLDSDGTGFLLWKRALKDRFKYVRQSIRSDEPVPSHKFKFVHKQGQTKSLDDPKKKKKNVLVPAKPKKPKTKKSMSSSGFSRLFKKLKRSTAISCQGSDTAFSRPSSRDALQEDEDYSIQIDGETAQHVAWFQKEYVKLVKDWEEVDVRMIRTLDVRRQMFNHEASLKQILRMFPFLRNPYQFFKECQFLTCTDVQKKTLQILEKHSESILTMNSVRDHPVNVMLYESMRKCTRVDVQKYLKMTATCLLLPVIFGEEFSEFAVLNGEVTVQRPILKVKNPFSFYGGEFSLYIGKEKLAQLDDCTMALAALLACFHVFHIPYPLKIETTLTALESMVFNKQNSLDVLEYVKMKIAEPASAESPGI